jgi:phosphohistidine swiveling domain-containing protein
VNGGIVRLDGHHRDRAELGGKGAALDRLIGWGLPVPPTVAVPAATVAALGSSSDVAAVVARARRGEVVPAGELDDAFTAAPWPEGLLEELLAAVRGLAGPVAVRSSATAEDLAGSSFAGQHRSVLAVDPTEAAGLRRAVALVAASLWHPAPCAYRRAMGIEERSAGMAVLLMRMVPARRAGVAFGVDPAGGAGLARVEWVDGLADALVSGRATPHALRLRRDGSGAVDGSPVPGEVAAALELARAVERLDGRPQDVEWAWDGVTVWIVQARPVTATGPPSDGFDDDPASLDGLELTTGGIAETMAGVLPPLRWEQNRLLVEHAVRSRCGELGGSPHATPATDGPLLRRIRGRVALDAQRLARITGAPSADRGGAGRRAGGSRRGSLRVGRDLRAGAVRNRAALEARIVVAAAAACEPGPLDALGIAALRARRTALVDLGLRAVAAEVAIGSEAAAGYERLEARLRRHVAPATAAVLTGVLATPVPPPPPGPTASASVFGGPTWAELGLDPTVGGAPRRPEPTRATRQADLVAAGMRTDGMLGWVRLRALHRLARDVAEQLGLREAAKQAALAIGGEVRRVERELGQRLVAAGRLRGSDDVELLGEAELSRVLTGGSPPSAEELGRRRRAQQAYRRAPVLPARFCGLPGSVALGTGPLGDRLHGWPASPGVAAGRARVVTDPAEPFEAGEILVAVATDPSWSPLFVRAAGLVLEHGGPLSHAAILARELGVPAVSEVVGATARLDGADVVVDGGEGVVAIRPAAEVHP